MTKKDDYAELRALQQNAWGRVTLGEVYVMVTYPDGANVRLELQIEPDVISRGDTWGPGVVYNPDYYFDSQFGDHEDVGETIAFCINDGQMLRDSIGDGAIHWHVIEAAPLHEHKVLTDPTLPQVAGSVYEYFAGSFGKRPQDTTLRDLPCESVCGEDCMRAIDHAVAAGIDPATCEATIRVYWHG